jgi:3-carboxy-cis,cis-muconate cycloisomerase
VPSHFIDFQLFGDQFSTPEIRAVFDERTMLQRWLDVEAALAHAQADLQLIPREAADAIGRAARVENLYLATIERDLAVTAHPLVPVVRELARIAGEAGRWVHWGATTPPWCSKSRRRTRSCAATSSRSRRSSPISRRPTATP